MLNADTIVHLLRNCVRSPERDQLMQDAADLIDQLREEIADLKAQVEGASHNRFYDQRDGYYEGLRDGKNGGDW